MTTFAWPAILKPRDFGFFFIDSDTSGGAALGGGEQIVFSPGPRWGAAMTLDVRSKDQVLALRSLRTNLKGRANPVALPNFDGQRLSWPEEMTASGDPTGVILHPGVTRNRALDGTEFADPEIPEESEIIAALTDDAALRATSIEIQVTQGGMPQIGQQFGLDHGGTVGTRLYEIGSMGISVIDPDVPAILTLNFLPPLRAAVAEGAAVNFTRPTCLMRCMNFGEEFRKLEMRRYATLNVEFVEYL